MTVDQYLMLPLGADEIIRRCILQFQIVVGDAVMVCPLFLCFLTWPRSLLITGVPHVSYL